MTNKKPNLDRPFIQFLLRAQQVAQQDPQSEKGYAMMVTSMVTIVMFSLLAAYMTMANLSKSSTNAYIDGTNTFYAAESGLNRRAEQLRRKFVGYSTPANKTAAANPVAISTCFPLSLTTSPTVDNDFECRNYPFRYNNNIAQTNSTDSSGGIVLSEQDGGRNSVQYTAYTFVKPKQDYTTTPPTSSPIPTGQAYAGLNSLEYRYTVYSTAAKPDPLNSTNPVAQSDGKTVLQMDFKSRVIPLFQFAAFYEDDLETNSIVKMTVSGPVHTNANLKTMSLETDSRTTFTEGTLYMDNVTVVGDVYHQSYGSGCDDCVVAVYKGSGDKTLRASYGFFPTDSTRLLNATQLAVFGTRLKSKVPRLNPPQPGFLREKNYKTGTTGLYYGKADLRLKFYPTRAMPFDLTPIKAGSGCSLTANNIPSDRQDSSALSCLPLTKGQLQSLRQPVLTKWTSATDLSPQNIEILKALRVAIASSPTLVTLSDLERPIVTTGGWGKTFKDLLTSIPVTILPITERDKLLPTTTAPGSTSTAAWPSPSPSPSPAWSSTSPSPSPSPSSCTVSALPTTKNVKDLVSAMCSTFLAAPIQQIAGTTNSTDPKINGGFYNQTSTDSGSFSTTAGNWMQMLQLNIESLTYWNRDGIYVEAANETLTESYTPTTTPLTLASGLSTDNLAFIKAPADATKPVGSFSNQGIAASDTTEGGMVFHATVSDDLDGNGTNDTTATATNKVQGKDDKGATIAHVDNYRIYPSGSGIRKSPYGFVLSGGVELPGPLTIATDQAAYIQGDYNNPGVAPGSLPQGTFYYPSNTASDEKGYRRQPAAIMADTLTFLSNQCVNANRQVNCGSKTTLVTSTSLPTVANGIAINAALLSNIMKSSSSATFNGGLNKYMKHLENWDEAATLNYTGSMVSLGEPLESDKLSVNNNSIYRRNYNYETRFNSFDKLPPLSPTVVYLQQDVFKRNY